MTDETKIVETAPVTTPQNTIKAPTGLTLGEKLKINALQKSSGIFNPLVYQQFKIMAQDMKNAGALPAGLNPEQALVVMQFGSELGIKPFTALQSIYMVNGKLTMYGSMVISRLTSKGYKITYMDKVSKVDDENACSVTVKKGDEEYTELYTYEMARLSGYTGEKKFGWKAGTNRIIKLRYGAVSLLLKTHLPHFLNGAEIKEVYEDITVEPTDDSVDKVVVFLDDVTLEKIREVKDVQELATVCKTLQAEKGDQYKNVILEVYKTRRAELEAKK